MMTNNGKRTYLSTIMDLETRDWVAYQICHRNDIDLVVNTLHNALQNNKEKDLNGLILHLDQGSQYLSTEYQQICLSNGIIVSHARKANPLDNVNFESFHSLLKKETLYNHPITTLEQYISIIHNWMTYYNTTRPRNKKIYFFYLSTFQVSLQWAPTELFQINFSKKSLNKHDKKLPL